jgi:hypothetical protein
MSNGCDLDTHKVWAVPRSLAATRGIVFTFSSSGYLDVSVPRVRLPLVTSGITGIAGWVAPFGNLRVKAYLTAYRSLTQLVTSFFAS